MATISAPRRAAARVRRARATVSVALGAAARRFRAPVLAALCLGALPATADAQTTPYRHAIGLGFSYPSGWEMQETELGLALVPADAARDALGQPLELFIVNAQDAPEVTAPDDPRVIDFFEQNALPLRRVGEPAPIVSGLGPGAILTFEGDTGEHVVRQRIYVTIHQGMGVYVVHMAREDLLAAREDAARALFASLEWELAEPAAGAGPRADASAPAAGGSTAGNLDPNLVRAWHRSSTSGSTGGGGSVWATDRETVVFGADGALVYAVGTTVSADVPNLSAYGRGDPNVRHGRWSIEGGMLVVRWEAGGSDTFVYNVFMHTDGMPALKIQPPGGEAIFFR